MDTSEDKMQTPPRKKSKKKHRYNTGVTNPSKEEIKEKTQVQYRCCKPLQERNERKHTGTIQVLQTPPRKK